mmetsp:Transcript_7686/g.20489  ORF Transcript_7686/g.20489 Transcript_7686/m.20489 type:complete len:101 (-) Transcript_7686:88-390(-)
MLGSHLHSGLDDIWHQLRICRRSVDKNLVSKQWQQAGGSLSQELRKLGFVPPPFSLAIQGIVAKEGKVLGALDLLDCVNVVARTSLPGWSSGAKNVPLAQ